MWHEKKKTKQLEDDYMKEYIKTSNLTSLLCSSLLKYEYYNMHELMKYDGDINYPIPNNS